MKTKFFLKTALGIIVVLIFIHIIISNSIATNGIELGKLEDQIQVYKENNTILKEEVLKESAYVHIASEAALMGFVKKDANISISSSLPLALNR